MLYQIQWRFPDKPNELVTEKEMSPKISKTFDTWVKDTIAEHPPPADAQVIVVTKKSQYFINE